MTDSKTAILGAVKRRQHGRDGGQDINTALAELGSAPAREIDEEEVLEHFLTRLKVNNIDLEVAASRSEAVKRIARFIYTEHNTHRAVAGNDRRLAALPWRDGGVLVRFGVAQPEDPVSISYARYGVAETGSVVLYGSRDNPAANNWLCVDHIVVLEARDLVASLEDAWEGIRRDNEGSGMPRGVNFISGPSSTGDIVGHIVKGAHGPQRLLVVYLGIVPDELLERTGHSIRPL